MPPPSDGMPPSETGVGPPIGEMPEAAASTADRGRPQVPGHADRRQRRPRFPVTGRWRKCRPVTRGRHLTAA
jgi:hypothetical protein